MKEKKMNKPLIELKSAIKTYTLDQDKVISPDETLNRVFNTLAATDANILDKIVRVANKLNIPMYSARGGADFVSVVNSSATTGKGATEVQAQASAMMELIERFTSFGYKYDITASYNHIKDEVKDFKIFFPLLNHVDDEENIIRNLSEVSLEWTPGYNLSKNENTLVPSIYKNIVGTNGLASGNTLEEAVLHGICEVMERHVLTRIESDRIITPEIRPDSIDHPIARDLMNKYKANNMKLILNDFTLDMGIPTIAAIAYYTTDDGLDMLYISAGTHTDPMKALIRALTELPQYIYNIDVLKKRSYSAERIHNIKFINEGMIRSGIVYKKDSDYLTNCSQQINMDEIKNYSQPDIKNEIEVCIDILAGHGIEIIVINKTHPVLNIPVVRVVGLNSMINSEDTNLSIYYYQGLCYKNSSDLRQAINALNKAAEINPEAERIYTELGLCHYMEYKKTMDVRHRDLAVLNFKKTIELERDMPNVPVYCQLASILINMGNLDEGKVFFSKAINLSPILISTPFYKKFAHLVN